MFGFWSRDLGDVDHKSIYIMEHFYKNTKVDKYKNMPGTESILSHLGLYDSLIMTHYKGFVKGQRENVYTLPSAWAGTGHLVLNGNVYFNRFNTSTITMYSLLVLGSNYNPKLL